jgi:hypothetical protein
LWEVSERVEVKMGSLQVRSGREGLQKVQFRWVSGDAVTRVLVDNDAGCQPLQNSYDGHDATLKEFE